MKRFYILVLLAVFFSLLSACSRQDRSSLPREDLFSLKIGKMEDQLDLFQMEGVPFADKTKLLMRDGIFYISNGNSFKVMEFNSYGDLLSMFYNPEENPRPVILTPVDAQEAPTNKPAYPHPFQRIGEIAVTGSRMLLVEDRVPEERRVQDENLEALLDRVVLRFSKEGKYIDYIGQEGIGGTPFPFIDGIDVTDNDEIVVRTRTSKAWLVYWFSKNGDHLFTVEISMTNLPMPDGPDVIPSLESVKAGPKNRLLYLKIDYYHEEVDLATRKLSGVDYSSSRIYTLDVEKERYSGFIEVPDNKVRQERPNILESNGFSYVYEFIGITRGGYTFLMSPDETNQYKLLILDSRGKAIVRKQIIIEDEDLIFKTFYLTPTGILCGLLCDPYNAKIVWWRSDKLIEADAHENR